MKITRDSQQELTTFDRGSRRKYVSNAKAFRRVLLSPSALRL